MTIEDCRSRLNSMVSLEKGWDSYGSDPPSGAALGNAGEFCAAAAEVDFLPDRVNPSAMGGVGITYRGDRPGRAVYVEFYNRGNAHALFSDDRGGLEMSTSPVDTTVGGYREFLAKARSYLGDEP